MAAAGEIIAKVPNTESTVFGKEESKLKELFWDDMINVLVSAIFALTLLNVVSEFFRGSKVECFTPEDYTGAQAEYVNNLCYQSLPPSQYYTVFIIAHGLGIIAPHYLWKAVFSGKHESIYRYAKELKLLQGGSVSKGDVSSWNEKFSGKALYLNYMGKLFLQLVIVTVAIFLGSLYFNDFSSTFVCPLSFNTTMDVTDTSTSTEILVSCVYSSLGFLRFVQIVDLALLGCVWLTVCLGLLNIVRVTVLEDGNDISGWHLKCWNYTVNALFCFCLDDYSFKNLDLKLFLYKLSRTDAVYAENIRKFLDPDKLKKSMYCSRQKLKFPFEQHYIIRNTIEGIIISLLKYNYTLHHRQSEWVVIYGMAGCGKTKLAQSIYQLRQSDCIWLTVGPMTNSSGKMDSDRLLAKIQDFFVTLDENPYHAHNLKEAIVYLRNVLAYDSILILDDVFSPDVAEVFEQLGRKTLVTTRNKGVASKVPLDPNNIHYFSVPEFSEDKGRELLCQWLQISKESLPLCTNKYCRGSPLAISIIGALLHDNCDTQQLHCKVIEKRLQEKHLGTIEVPSSIIKWQYQYRTVDAAIKGNIEQLPEHLQNCLEECVVFEHGANVSSIAFATLLGVDELDAVMIIKELSSYSMAILEKSEEHISFTIPDLIRDYLHSAVPTEKQIELHKRVVQCYRTRCSYKFHTLPDDGYVHKYLLVHVAASGDYDLLLQIITNKQWWTASEQHVDTDTVVRLYMSKVPDQEFHKKVVQHYRAKCNSQFHTLPDDGYVHKYLLIHVAASGDYDLPLQIINNEKLQKAFSGQHTDTDTFIKLYIDQVPNKEFHMKVVQHYRKKCGSQFHTLPDDGYVHKYLLIHVAASGDYDLLLQIITNKQWWAACSGQHVDTDTVVTRYMDQVPEKEFHMKVVQYYRKKCNKKFHTLPDDGYVHKYLLIHVAASGDYDLLVQIITNKQWWTASEQHADTDTVVMRYMDEVPNKEKLHKKVVQYYRKKQWDYHTLPDDGYVHKYLLMHVAASGNYDLLLKIITNKQWWVASEQHVDTDTVVMRYCNMDKVPEKEELHKKVVEYYWGECYGNYHTLPDDGYVHKYLLMHVAASAKITFGYYDNLLKIITNKQWWTACKQHADTDTVVMRYMDQVSNKEELHKKVVQHYRKDCDGNYYTLPDDGYVHKYLLTHVAALGDYDLLLQIITNEQWWTACSEQHVDTDTVVTRYMDKVSNKEKLHKKVVQYYWKECDGDYHTLPDDGYVHKYLLMHLAGTGTDECDLGYLMSSKQWVETSIQYAGIGRVSMSYSLYMDQVAYQYKDEVEEIEQDLHRRCASTETQPGGSAVQQKPQQHTSVQIDAEDNAIQQECEEEPHCL